MATGLTIAVFALLGMGHDWARGTRTRGEDDAMILVNYLAAAALLCIGLYVC